VKHTSEKSPTVQHIIAHDITEEIITWHDPTNQIALWKVTHCAWWISWPNNCTWYYWGNYPTNQIARWNKGWQMWELCSECK